jgi:hypothetical protein
MIPGCIQFIGEAVIVGRVTICNRCEQELKIGKSMHRPRPVVRPHCDACRRVVFNRRTGEVQMGRGQLPLVPVREGESREPEITLDFVDSLLKDFGVK